jgi:rfaE bifunctional protein nucleotidyltransferase chain/domain
MTRPIVLAAGVFDILHPGHVAYLEAARALGASLIVGINGDESARALCKGPGRPINCAHDRLRVLEALRCVDEVAIFDEPTPEALILRIKPDVFVKGGDYAFCEISEAAAVQSYGGRVEILPFVLGYSTSRIVGRIRG